jgi:methyl-accepting chemotaxis protein
MSIKNTLLVAYGLITLGILGLGGLSLLMSNAYTQLNEKHEQRYQSYLLADELRQSSDDLTRMARTYVMTADPRYEQMYWHILDIRNGKKPRPKDYWRIYWDLVLDYGDKPRPEGKAEPLQDLMRAAGFTEQEFASLRQAQANSDALVTTETIAMNAMKGLYDDGSGNYTKQDAPDVEMARRIMHDIKYHKDKAAIMTPIDQFFISLDQRTRADVNAYQEKIDSLQFYFKLLAGALIVMVGGISFAVARRVLMQVGGEPKHIARIADYVAAGDLVISNQTDNGQGIRAALISMTNKLRELISSIHTSSSEVSASATQLAATTKQHKASIMAQVESTDMMVHSVGEISRLSRDLLNTMEQVAQMTEATSKFAASGQTELNEMTQAMTHMESASKSISNRLSTINEKNDNITSVVTTITKVADQTNLLSLNAAIEAEKAGEYGHGFNIVAREIRRLADQTAVATLDIESMVKDMQSAVSAGVMEMDKFISVVRQSADSVAKISTQLNKIIAQVQELSPNFERVKTAMTEQSNYTNQISEQITSLGDGIRETAETLEESFQAINVLHDATHNLQQEILYFKV